MKKIVMIALCVGTSYTWVAAQEEESEAAMSEATRYKNYLNDRGIKKPVITDNLNDFVAEVVKLTNGKAFAAYEYLGFSGAGYENLDQYKKDFERAVLQASKDTRKRYGSSAKTIFLLGGTTDGFGVGYQVIDSLIAQKKLLRQDVIVGGLVSDAAVKYQFEGMEKGWSDVISPYQDVLLLMNVDKEPGKTEGWELRKNKSGSATVDVLTKLFAQPNARYISLELFEGGEIASKEAREFLRQWEGKMFIATKGIRMVLRPGYHPKKPEKLKGVPAATDLATDPDVISQGFVFLQPIGSSDMTPLFKKQPKEEPTFKAMAE